MDFDSSRAPQCSLKHTPVSKRIISQYFWQETRLYESHACVSSDAVHKCIVLSSCGCNCMFDLRSYFWWYCFSIISIHSLVISVVVSLFVVAKFAVPMRATLLRNLPQVQQVAAGGSFCVALTGKLITLQHVFKQKKIHRHNKDNILLKSGCRI